MLKIGTFVNQVKLEMEKVSWPTKHELLSSTVVVLISLVVLGAYIGVCDLVLSQCVNFLLSGVFK